MQSAELAMIDSVRLSVGQSIRHGSGPPFPGSTIPGIH